MFSSSEKLGSVHTRALQQSRTARNDVESLIGQRAKHAFSDGHVACGSTCPDADQRARPPGSLDRRRP